MRKIAFLESLRKVLVVAASAALQTTKVVTAGLQTTKVVTTSLQTIKVVTTGLRTTKVVTTVRSGKCPVVGISLILAAALTACGGPAPASPPPQATVAPPTAPAPPTFTPEPTPTPLSLSDVASEFRTFVNDAYQYAIQVPFDWEITPRGAGHADRIEVTAPGSAEIRGPNIVPPLVFAISVVEPDAGYHSFDDVEANRATGDDILDKVDLQVSGLPARRIHSRDAVYGDSFHYIIQRDTQFFIVDVHGYDKLPIEPILNTFGRPPERTPASVSGQVQELDAEARTMTVVDESGSGQPVIWFTDTELLPRGRLEGFIDPGDRVTVEGTAGERDRIEATQITLESPEHAGGEPVLEFQRLGGIAGFQDRLVVFDDGVARIQRGSQAPVEVNLSEEQWKQVKNYVAIFEPFAWRQADNPGGPDNLVTDLDFYGAGKFEAAFDNQKEIVGYMQELLAQLSE